MYSTLGGETYFALAERPYYDTVYSFQTFVRMDWLEQVGYDHVPTKRSEYLDAMNKIMEQVFVKHPGGGAMLTGVGSDQNQHTELILATRKSGLCTAITTFQHLDGSKLQPVKESK